MDSAPEAELDPSSPGGSWFFRNRSRIARVVALGGALVIGSTFVDSAPREVAIRFELGQGHATVDRLDITYLSSGDPLQHATFRFPEGAPATLDHRVRVSPGRYDVELRLHPRGEGSVRRATASFSSPADGVVRITPQVLETRSIQRRTEAGDHDAEGPTP